MPFESYDTMPLLMCRQNNLCKDNETQSHLFAPEKGDLALFGRVSFHLNSETFITYSIKKQLEMVPCLSDTTPKKRCMYLPPILSTFTKVKRVVYPLPYSNSYQLMFSLVLSVKSHLTLPSIILKRIQNIILSTQTPCTFNKTSICTFLVNDQVVPNSPVSVEVFCPKGKELFLFSLLFYKLAMGIAGLVPKQSFLYFKFQLLYIY